MFNDMFFWFHQSPGPAGVLNGSPLYRAHARLTSPVFQCFPSPSEPKTETISEPNTESFESSIELQNESYSEHNITDRAETITDLSADHSQSKISTQVQSDVFILFLINKVEPCFSFSVTFSASFRVTLILTYLRFCSHSLVAC